MRKSRRVNEAMPGNLLEMKFSRSIDWEPADEGVVLLVPKFRNPFLVRWLMPRLAKPHFRVHLDAVGGFIWQKCDGDTTVLEIGDQLKREFGDSVEPVYERMGMFIRKLRDEEFLSLVPDADVEASG